MSEFNNDEYLRGQITKQYYEELITVCKQALDFSPFEEAMNKITDERMMTLDGYILEADLVKVNSDIKNECYTYVELLIYYLKRILKFDVNGFNTILELNPDALKQAKLCEYNENNNLLYGIPTIIKANIGTKNMHTSAGAMALKNFKCDDDANIVKKLNEVNAVIIGTANLSEWANFMSTESSNGYSTLGGQTKNPYGHFDVGGSSAGSASGVSNNFSCLSIGTETAGSIIYPASQNAVVGLKPTLGLVSGDKIIPISKSHDTAGPITRNVLDATYLFNEIIDDEMKVDNIKFNKDFLKGKRIAIINNKQVINTYRDSDKSIISRIAEELTTIGAQVEQTHLLESGFEAEVYDIFKYEFRHGIKTFLKTGRTEHAKLEDIIAFNECDMKNFAPYNQEIINQSIIEDLTEEEINTQIENNRKVTRMALDKIFETYDVVMTLSNYLTSVYAPSGYPAINVPSGYRDNNEPIGLTFIGKEFEDFYILECAYSYEQNTKHRKRP